MIVAVIPAYNEEATIAKVILQTRPYVNQIIVCDDGSEDMTYDIAEALGVTVLRHARNMGKGSALRTLFNTARSVGADIVVTIDADGQHDPNEIPKLTKALQARRADIVVGSRFMKEMKGKTKVPRRRAIGNKMLNAITDRHIADTQSGFRAYSRVALRCLVPTEMGIGVDSELIMKAEEKKLRMVEVPITVRYDVPYPSKQGSVSQAGGVALSVIKRLSIRRPLSFYGIPGVVALSISLIFWIWTIQNFAATRQVITNVTLIAIGATMVGLMLLTTAVILWVLVSVVRETSIVEGQSYRRPSN